MPKNKDKKEEAKKAIPEWLLQVRKKITAQTAHAIVVHGKINDYVDAGVTASRALIETLTLNYSVNAAGSSDGIVAVVSRDGGLRYTLPSMEALAKPYAPPAPTGPMAALQTPSVYSTLSWLSQVQIKSKGSIRVAVVIEYAETILPDSSIPQMSPEERNLLSLLQRWGVERKFGRLILLTTDYADITTQLKKSLSGFASIEIGIPEPEIRDQVLNSYIADSANAGDEIEFEDGFGVDGFAQLSTGLSNVSMINILRDARAGGKQVTKNDVIRMKREVIKTEFGGILEIEEPTFNLSSIGGMNEAKWFIEKRVRNRILNRDLWDTVPMGMCFSGPPGTGKTIFARAMAGSVGMPFFNLKIAGNILDKYVGESEKRLQKALAAIKAYGGFYFIDEADQVLGRGGDNGNSVSSNIFGMMLEFMSQTENRGRVIAILATNWPSKLDDALRRAGRIDAHIPFLAPEVETRSEIIRIHTAKRIKGISDFSWVDEIAERSAGWTGAEIEGASFVAADALNDGDANTIADAWRIALGTVFPNTTKIQEMEADAFSVCSDIRLVPPSRRGQFTAIKQAKSLVQQGEPAAEGIDRWE